MASQVILNVYDLSSNGASYYVGLGFYHTGVEVNQREFTFGQDGGFSHEPKAAPGAAQYRQSILLGTTDLRYSQIESIAQDLAMEFRKRGYHIRKNNCNDYSKAFAEKLVGAQNLKFPGWINRMAAIGNKLPFLMPDNSPSSPEPEQPAFTAFKGKGKTLGYTPSTPTKPGLLKRVTSFGSNASTSTTTPTTPVAEPISPVAADRERIFKATQARLQQNASSNAPE